MKPQTLLLELNELNFDYVRFYIAEGKLPHLGALVASHGVSETISETRYEELEPWIQWVTAHTGLTFAEHGVFRLGDIASSSIRQIWEDLEEAGLKVGAISPMNARHNLREPAFFVPDPWTDTQVSASWTDRRFYRALREAVNENASGRMSLGAQIGLLFGLLRNAAPRNYSEYFRLLGASRKSPWVKAIFLDRLLAEMFIRLTKAHEPHFASLFLNAGAHIQHHYMFNSAAYKGRNRNPAWYVAPSMDPLLHVYQAYDAILEQVRRSFPDARLMIATALHQDPCPVPVYYWRLERPAEFLSALEIPYLSIEPRMSRDFLISCSDPEQAREAERLLGRVTSTDGAALFEVDNRGDSLFVTLIFDRDIPEDLGAVLDARKLSGLRQHVSFVALKNGQHNGVGYFCDTGVQAAQKSFPLPQLFHRIRQSLPSRATSRV